MNAYRFLWRFFRPYLAWLAVALVASLLSSAAQVSLVWLIRPLFSDVLLADGVAGVPMLPIGGKEVGGEASGPGAELAKVDLSGQLERAYHRLEQHFGVGPDTVVYFLPLVFLTVFLVRSAADFVNGYSFQRIGLGATTDVRNSLYRRILEHGSGFYAGHSSGELVSRVVNDVSQIQGAIANRVLYLFQQILTLIGLLWLLLSTHTQLALVCLVATPVLVVPIVRFGKGMRRTSHRSQERMADLANLVNEGVRGFRVVKAFGMEGFEYRRFWEASRRHLRVNLRAQLLANLSSPVVESLAVVGASGLLVYAGLTIRRGELSPSNFIGFLFTLFLMYDPIRKLNSLNLVLQQAIAAAQRVAGVLAVPVDIENQPGAVELTGFRTGIRYRGVTFAYEKQPVVRDIDLEIKAGEIVALVGRSGAGKSTLINLLLRFFDPGEGQVEIDGTDIRRFTLGSLRSQIGLVTQDTVLFNDTVRNNIAYGREDIPAEKVEAAALSAFAHDFIMAMPEGYETVVGEAGQRLSGGQKQRLAIARALLKDAPILVLDEATSQLDSESEALVQQALGNLTRGRTTLVVAHRLSTVMSADRIVVLDDGRIVQEGRHEELIAEEGIYRRLYELQFRPGPENGTANGGSEGAPGESRRHEHAKHDG